MIFLDQNDDSNSDTGQVWVCQTANVCSSNPGSGNGRPGRGQQQPVRVISVSGSGPYTVGISPGVRMPNWRSSQSPQAWWSNSLPVTGDGVEDLSMDHTNTSSSIAAGVFVLNAYNVWFKNIRDINSQHKHIWFYQSAANVVRDSYFYGSWNAASESYGVDTYNGADNLIENNIFQHIATGMINEGCVGCVFAHNYAIDDYYTANGSAPAWQQFALYGHSVGDAYVLWEGNQAVGLVGDDIHGTRHFITAFRNYLSGRDAASTTPKTQQTSVIILEAYNRYFNIIGNVHGHARVSLELSGRSIVGDRRWKRLDGKRLDLQFRVFRQRRHSWRVQQRHDAPAHDDAVGKLRQREQRGAVRRLGGANRPEPVQQSPSEQPGSAGFVALVVAAGVSGGHHGGRRRGRRLDRTSPAAMCRGLAATRTTSPRSFAMPTAQSMRATQVQRTAACSCSTPPDATSRAVAVSRPRRT